MCHRLQAPPRAISGAKLQLPAFYENWKGLVDASHAFAFLISFRIFHPPHPPSLARLKILLVPIHRDSALHVRILAEASPQNY